MIRRRLLIDFGWTNRPTCTRRPARYIPKEVLLVLNKREHILVRLVAIGDDWFAILRRHYGSRVAIHDDRSERYRRVKSAHESGSVIPSLGRRRASERRGAVSPALRRVWDADAALTEAYERYDALHAAYTSVRDRGHVPGRWLRDALRRRWMESVVAEQRAVATLEAYLDGRKDLFIPRIEGQA